MGSHRSQPLLKKETVLKTWKNITYGVTHMCGIDFINQGWRLYM